MQPSAVLGLTAAANPSWSYVLLAWVAALGGAGAAYYFFRRLRAVLNTPRSTIRAAAQGYVELQGEARLMPGEPIIAPLTQRRCVWWSCHVQERVTAGRSVRWDTVRRDSSTDLFLVEDGTGQCVVDPEHAAVYPSARDVWYGDTPDPEGGPALGRFAVASRYRYEEERMHEEDALYALGYFHTQGPPSSGDIDEEVRQQLAAWKQDQAALLQRFDVNHDGVVDQQEWEVARQEARRLVLEQERQAMSRPPLNVLGRPPDGRDFILSTLPQRKLEWRLRVYIAAGLLLFIGGGAYGSYMLTARIAGGAPVQSGAP